MYQEQSCSEKLRYGSSLILGTFSDRIELIELRYGSSLIGLELMLSPKSDVLVKFGKIVKVKEKTQIKEAKDTTVIGHMYNGTHSFLHCVYLEQFSPYTCHINTPGKWSIFTLLET